MIKFITKGFTKEVFYPEYGKQDIGISPYGAMDMFSVRSANALLMEHGTTYEFMVSAPVIEFTEKSTFVITGAHRNPTMNDEPIENGTVILASVGDVLKFGKLTKGFRTYITMHKGHSSLVGNKRKAFNEYKWPDKEGFIRVVAGPEYNVLENPMETLQSWRVGAHDDMGMRLKGKPLSQKPMSMISGAVADGTIQLSPDGLPTILLKNRQTVGGYPRVLNVISADVDLLAQYYQNQKLKFKMVSLKEAEQVAIMKRFEELES
jgi:allophanate hydrolase subunit 2